MSLEIKKEQICEEKETVTAIICDDCGKRITSEDIIEWQEAYSIRLMGGYGSIFGDGTTVRIDLCQHCLMKRIKDLYKKCYDTFEQGGF